MVNGTLNIKTSDGNLVRKSSVIEVIVDINLQQGDLLPKDAYAVLNVDFGGVLTCSPIQQFVTQPTLLNDPIRAEAIFYVAVNSIFQGEILLQLTASATGLNAPFISRIYQVVDDAKVVYIDPDPVYLHVSSDDQQSPLSQSSTVHYSASAYGMHGPLENYIIEWYQDWDAGVFGSMRAFSSFSEDTLLVPDYYTSGGCVRTKTNSLGVANLYLVTTTQPLYFALRPTGNCAEPTPLTPVIVVGNQAALQEPSTTLLFNEKHVADLDNTPGAFVDTLVPANSFISNELIQVLLFLNTVLVGNQKVIFTNSSIKDLVFNIPKINFFSNTGPNANKINSLYYVRAIKGKDVQISYSLEFQAEGDIGNNTPNPVIKRYLLKPEILYIYNNSYINFDTIQDNLLIAISLLQDSSYWLPELGDQITTTIYINAWNAQTRNLQQNCVSQALTLTENNLKSANIVFTFPRYEIINYDSSPTMITSPGTFYAEYYVTKGSADKVTDVIQSEFIKVGIDTSPPGC